MANLPEMGEENMDELIDEATKKYDFLRFTYTDMYGISRSKTVCKSGFRKFLQCGIGVHVVSIGFGLRGGYDPGVLVCDNLEAAGYESDSNVFARPIPGTLHALPSVGKYTQGQVLCETFHALTGHRQQELPRCVARRQLARLQALGYELYSSFELEFVLVNPKTLDPVFDNPGDMLVNSIIDQFNPVLMEIASNLEAIGVHVETLQTENSQGQFEIVLKPQCGIKIADHAILAKDCVKFVARSHGHEAVFMTKYSETAEYCNSAHFNHSLRRCKSGCGNRSAFSDLSGSDKLSDVFRYWLGGLTRHFRSMNMFCGPTFNCYRRLHRGSLKIASSEWGLDDRMGGFRVKNYTPESTYIESRLPSGSSNPYLVLAATLAAGIDGLEQQLPCPFPKPKPHTDPSLNAEYYCKMDPTLLPVTLPEGIQALEDDQIMVDAMGKDFIQWFIGLKEDEIKLLSNCDIEKENPDMYAQERFLYMDLI